MNTEDQKLKPYLQVLAGTTFVVVYGKLKSVLESSRDLVGVSRYSPEEEFFLISFKWFSFAAAVYLLIIGLATILKKYWR